MRIAKREDKGLVVSILMSAFLEIKEGNSLNYFIRGEKNREKRAKHLFEFIFDRSLHTGEVYISKNEKGCILVERSAKQKFSYSLLLKKLRATYLSIGFKNIPRILKRERLLHQFHTDENFVHPSAMAAHSSINGSGTCVRMIKELLKTHKGEPITIYTETTTLDNLKIYEKFGFRVIGESIELGFPMYFLAKRVV